MRTLALFALLLIVAFAAAQTEAAGQSRIVWPGRVEIHQGELKEIYVSGEEIAAVEGKLGKEKIHFFPRDAVFTAVIGADVAAKPGDQRLLLLATDRAGRKISGAVPFRIKAKVFRSESFNVPPGFDRMTPETLEEIRREQTAFAEVFGSPIAERLWDVPFVRPVPQEASASSFGSRRIINGVARAPHSGTDLSAPMGTEVLAANHGRAVLVGNYFFAGGSVVLDHGGGLFTMYFHLSDLKVEEGAMVKRGEVIGLSGSSGRVTGPHLHWGARLANSRIEPFELLTKISNGWQPAGQAESTPSRMEKMEKQDGP